jgi:uncharacterized protein
MGEQQNVEIVKQGYDAFGRGDIETLLGVFDPQIEWISPGPADLPTAGSRRGLQQVREFFRAVDEVFEIQRFEPKTFVAQGDLVVVLGEDSSRVKATGKVLNGAWAHAFTLKDGKILRFQEYIDTAEVVAELRTVQTRT